MNQRVSKRTNAFVIEAMSELIGQWDDESGWINQSLSEWVRWVGQWVNNSGSMWLITGVLKLHSYIFIIISKEIFNPTIPYSTGPSSKRTRSRRCRWCFSLYQLSHMCMCVRLDTCVHDYLCLVAAPRRSNLPFSPRLPGFTGKRKHTHIICLFS